MTKDRPATPTAALSRGERLSQLGTSTGLVVAEEDEGIVARGEERLEAIAPGREILF